MNEWDAIVNTEWVFVYIEMQLMTEGHKWPKMHWNYELFES